MQFTGKIERASSFFIPNPHFVLNTWAVHRIVVLGNLQQFKSKLHINNRFTWTDPHSTFFHQKLIAFQTARAKTRTAHRIPRISRLRSQSHRPVTPTTTKWASSASDDRHLHAQSSPDTLAAFRRRYGKPAIDRFRSKAQKEAPPLLRVSRIFRPRALMSRAFFQLNSLRKK